IGVLAAYRPGSEFAPADCWIEHEVGPLTQRDSEALVAARFPDLDAPVQRHIVANACGNPLALVELPNVLTADHLNVPATPSAVLVPLTPRLTALYAHSVSAL